MPLVAGAQENTYSRQIYKEPTVSAVNFNPRLIHINYT